MRNSLLLAGVATLLLVAPMAMAAQTSTTSQATGTKTASMAPQHNGKSGSLALHHTTGTVKSVDAKTGTLELSSGATYYLGKSAGGDKLKKGEHVRVSWMMKSGRHEASKVSVIR